MSDKKIFTWKDLNDNDSHDKDDEMRNFVGGGKNAGQMTVNPKAKVTNLFEKVKEFGAQSIDEAGPQPVDPFTGGAYQIGTEQRCVVPSSVEQRVVITFWKGL
eukprot:TRINITY_DN3404_c0_g1_i5.p2 TRINITY_DN3404_c0_g1~~TRINITY_DN3404_c0_g1_i5.p2  ORF type:complete len:103 (+),score=25.88 TRINITY_DN3404_c0_g1_i5:69-377(+)